MAEPGTNTATPTVAVDGGLITGIVQAEGALNAYLGIPYAAPPIGRLRWRAPAPVRPWSGVRACNRFGDACVQPPIPADAIMGLLSFGTPPESGTSEDCLHLNIWAPAQASEHRLPVLVWIHGGAHRVGAGSHPLYWGDRLAAKGLIVVSINYRLGPLGYLAHPALSEEAGASGNYASLDIIAALRWVRANIEAFGGNPECITLYGHSAGAAHVNGLMTSPLSRGLFHRAIGSSGGRFDSDLVGIPMRDLAEAEEAGKAFAEALGAPTLEQMRALPAEQLLSQPTACDLIIDGHVFTQSVRSSFAAGAQMAIPLMAGFNSNEASPYPALDLHTVNAWTGYAQATYGDKAAHFLTLYPARDDLEAAQASYTARRDSSMAFQPWKWATAHRRTAQAPVFFYYFDQPLSLPPAQIYREPRPAEGFGAFHGAELPFAFNSFAHRHLPYSPADKQIAETFGGYIAAFARTGDPNAAALTDWPIFNSTEGPILRIGETIEQTNLPNAAALSFFEAYFK